MTHRVQSRAEQRGPGPDIVPMTCHSCDLLPPLIPHLTFQHITIISYNKSINRLICLLSENVYDLIVAKHNQTPHKTHPEACIISLLSDYQYKHIDKYKLNFITEMKNKTNR